MDGVTEMAGVVGVQSHQQSWGCLSGCVFCRAAFGPSIHPSIHGLTSSTDPDTPIHPSTHAAVPLCTAEHGRMAADDGAPHDADAVAGECVGSVGVGLGA